MAIALKKMASSDICGNLSELVSNSDLFPKDNAVVAIYRVWGKATGFRTGTKYDKPWYGFAGRFGAVNLMTGEEFTACEVFLSNPIESLLIQALAESDAVEFSVEVKLKRRDTLPIKYEFLQEPLLDVVESDELARLRDLSMKQKALPAPTNEVKPAKKGKAA